MKRVSTISGLMLLLLILSSSVIAQNITVKGKVTDTSNEPLPGVSVVVKGNTTGTTTDANGVYSLSVAANGVLSYSFIGMQSQTIEVAGRPVINVKLAGQSNELQQVVVIGYGTQRKIDNTGAVASVKGSDIAKQAAQNPLAALQGKVSGVQITNNGQPGASPQVTIRGLGTYYGSTSPLYVVDGVWYDDISFLNNADIENMSILKDASSTAIYGIRAANGVILITTKRGAKSKVSIDYNGYVGFQKATNVVKMADATEYATAVNELAATNSGSPVFSNVSSLGKGTNWYDQILRDAFVTNHQLSANGGTDKYSYNYSFGYLNQDGLVKKNNYQRYTARIANDFKPVKALKIGFNASGLFGNSADAPGNIFTQLYGAAPTLPVFTADGKYGDPSNYGTGDGNNYNPQATVDFYNQRSKNYRVTGNTYAEVSFLKHFKFKTSLGADAGQAEVRNYTPLYYATTKQTSNVTTLDVNHTETRNWIWENTLTYDYQVKDHKITALLGYSAQDYHTYENDAKANNVDYTKSGSLTSSFPAGSNPVYYADPALQLHKTYLSQFARVNYSFKDRYLINASIRRDGASQFYGSDTYGYFPSVGAGWVITNEGFMKDQHIFNVLKLRGSWGKVGNAVVPINPTVQTVAQDPYLTAIFGNPQQTYQGASINTIVPSAIKWENIGSADFGIEGSLLKSRLSFEADYYNRTTNDAIFAIPVLASLGTSGGTLIGNQAQINNKGFEGTLTWRESSGKDFTYSISGNIGFNTNKVLNVLTGNNAIYGGGGGIANGNYATRTVQGEPIGEFYGYQVTGVFQTAAQVAASKQTSAKPGDFIYQDTNGDGVISSTDRVVLGNPNPKYTYGFNTSFTYKRFDLALDFQGVGDVSVYNAVLGYRFGNENFTQNFYDNRWHGAGTSNTYSSTNIGANGNSQPNSFFVESGAYFRMRNAQLGYTIPTGALSKLRIQKIRVYANAQNAVNIFGYKGFTPEIAGNVGSRGIDSNVYPLYATYNFGVNVTF
jgi:TonB-linked SusC/RagA family outer membrane protein